MNNPKTTIWGSIASIAGAVSLSLTGLPQLILQIVAGAAGSIFAYHSTDAKK